MRLSTVAKILIITTIIFSLSTLEAGEYKPSLSKGSTSGIEVRINGLYSSGRFVQDLTPEGTSTEQTSQDTSDLTTKGFSVLLGYGREYRRQTQSSFLYIGYENQKWNDAYDSQYHAFIIGAEGGLGSRSVKFIYGGEFAFGALATGVDGLGYLSTFTAEPYVGFRLLSTMGLSLNFRVGARFYAIEHADLFSSSGSNVLSENSAYSGNVQIGLGYRFY